MKKLQIRSFKLKDLQPAAYNPRTISDESLAGLAKSIERFGCVEPIVVNIRGGRNTIVGGHQRYRVLEAAGVKDCMCVTVDLSKADEKVLNLTLNNPETQGEFVAELGDYIDKLRKQISEADYLGFRIDFLRRQFPDAEKMGQALDDDIPEPPKKATTKPGDLWLLGKHRLLCGDSTNEADVKRLMGRHKASLFATDPPYCVDYTGADRPGGGKDWSDTFREFEIPDAREFIKAFYSVGLKFIKPKTALYLWHASKRIAQIHDVCNDLGILIHQPIIWVKPLAVLTFSYYSWRHEPCLLMWIRGQNPEYKPKDKSIGTVWPIGFVKTGDPTTPEYYTDVWELDWEGKKRNPGIEHPTVKPVEVFAIPMRVHTRPGDICYEPFCGSGSQLIAAEKLDRRCFAMELEPVFCDVAVKRWEEWSGQRAKLAPGGGKVAKTKKKTATRRTGGRRGRTGAGR